MQERYNEDKFFYTVINGKEVTVTFFLTALRVNDVTVKKFLGLCNVNDLTVNIKFWQSNLTN